MIYLRYCFVFVWVLIAAPSFGADSSGKFTVLSMGTKSCGEVVADFKEDGRGKFNNSIWVAGYITAVNEHVASRSNITAGTDPAAWDQWINNYCMAKPLESLASATAALVKELSKKRK
jgi:hypothetical protein